MGTSTFSGPVRSGTVRDGSTANVGYAVLSKTGLINFGATLVQDLTFYLPANAQLIDILVDTLTAYDSATSATLSVGTSSGDTSYASSVDVKTASTRIRPTFTLAQLAAMDDIGTSTSVVATVTSVGQPTAGSVRVTLIYAQY